MVLQKLVADGTSDANNKAPSARVGTGKGLATGSRRDADEHGRLR